MTANEFIKTLWPTINKVGDEVGMSDIIKQVCLAQACLETGYGSSGLMVKAHALFGIKATKSWKGKVYSAKTRELYSSIEQTVSAVFRAYDTVADSIRDYYKLISGKRYAKALKADTVAEAIRIIASSGYATDPNYSDKVIKIYDDYILGNISIVKEASKLNQVNSISSDIDQLARDCIRGKYGNGETRKKLLGANYAAVQHRVNILLRGGK